MPRIKTYLSPDEQWQRTAAYHPRLHRADAPQRWAAWLKRHAGTTRGSHGGLADEAELRAMWLAERRRCEIVGADRWDPTWVGIVLNPHRWTLPGDALRVSMTNGMNERWALTGITSKGVHLEHYYLQGEEAGHRSRHVRWVYMPEALRGNRWDSEPVRAFVDEVRADVLAARPRI